MKSYKKFKKPIKKNKSKRRKYRGGNIVVCPNCKHRNGRSICVHSFDHGFYQDWCTCEKCGNTFEYEGLVD